MPFESQQANLKRLKQTYAEAFRRTVFFVGAGPSTEIGLPNWYDLAKGLFAEIDSATPSSALGKNLLEAFNEAEEQLGDGKLWDFFRTIEQAWPQQYEDYLALVFSDAHLENCDVPSVYRKIWRMRNVGQVLTLNIDGLVRRAYEEVSGSNGAQILEFPGTSAIDSKSYFARNYPVILNLHGLYTRRSTWVMNAAERKGLFENFKKGDYKSFLRHIFESYNVVFVGVNIRDVVISPIIEEISKSGLLQDHYWIVPKISSDDYSWTQQNGVRAINYVPEMSESGKQAHSSVICSILDEIEEFRSFDRPAILPKRNRVEGPSFDDQKELLGEAATHPMKARTKLDARIENLGQEHGFDGKQVAGFIREYETPIELVSILGTTPPYNTVENVTISTNVSSTNASNVWLALQADGTTMCAVKALSGQAFKDSIERESFRRGMESLYQLNKTNKPVAPKFLFHTNVPLALGMEFVEGASLSDFMESSPNLVHDSWFVIFQQICEALLVCHISEGEVLHRDLKPKNILFEGAYLGCDLDEFVGCTIRFINFDMSWHKFSVGNTKSVSADEVGYYAPEQRNLENADTPRTTKTDIYMLGMIMIFLVSELPPPEGGANLEGWELYIRQKVNSREPDKLIRSRLARLLIRMTQSNPEDRPDLQSVIMDLELIHFASNSDWRKSDPDFFVEKTIAEFGYDYEWSDDEFKGVIQTPRQIELSISYRHRGQKIELMWMRQRDDGTDRRNFGGKLGELSKNVKQQLRDFGWDVDEGGGHHSRSISATMKMVHALEDSNAFMENTRAIVGRLMGDM
jgi:eukaryotic-like serine/threonine-protein kinase